MVAGGLGVTLLPASAVSSDAVPPDVAVRPFRKPPPTREIGLLWRRTSARGEEFSALGELLRRKAPKVR